MQREREGERSVDSRKLEAASREDNGTEAWHRGHTTGTEAVKTTKHRDCTMEQEDKQKKARRPCKKADPAPPEIALTALQPSPS